MKSKPMFLILIALIGLSVPYTLPAQWQFRAYADAGEHNASEGFYLRSTASVSYALPTTRLSGGLQFELTGNTPRVLTGVQINILQDLQIREFPFKIGAFVLHKPYSDLLYENNVGLLAQTDLRQFHIMLGNGFRAYRLTRQAIDAFPGTDNTVIRENWNLIYRIGYDLKPAEHPWNAGIAVTNFDHFLMNQETNPMLSVYGRYEAVPDLDLFMEAWYKHAGVFNISANYFGFFFRMGVSYEI
jgi:hypothetical protein